MTLLYGPANITRQELAYINTPEPQGPWHQPVPFGDYVDMITDALVKEDIVITLEEFQVVKNDMQLFGAMAVAPANDEFLPGLETNLVLGIRGSHDKIVPRGICIGTQVMVCSNLCFDGNMATASTRQTKNIFHRLPDMIRDIVRRIRSEATLQETRLNAYKNANLGTSQMGDALIVELFRNKVMSTAQFTKSLDEWVEPTFAKHQEDGDYSVWNLFNAVTQSMKPQADLDDAHVFNHSLLQTRTQKLTQSLDTHLGLDLRQAA